MNLILDDGLFTADTAWGCGERQLVPVMKPVHLTTPLKHLTKFTYASDGLCVWSAIVRLSSYPVCVRARLLAFVENGLCRIQAANVALPVLFREKWRDIRVKSFSRDVCVRYGLQHYLFMNIIRSNVLGSTHAELGTPFTLPFISQDFTLVETPRYTYNSPGGEAQS